MRSTLCTLYSYLYTLYYVLSTHISSFHFLPITIGINFQLSILHFQFQDY
jgi:hypothetical protein